MLSVLLWLALVAAASSSVSAQVFSPPGELSIADQPGWSPRVSTDGAGNWVAVWQSEDDLGGTIGSDSDILVARSADNGTSWAAPAALNTNAASDTGDDTRPQLSTDGAGIWLAVWQSSDDLSGTIGTDRDVLIARSTDNGASWSAPTALNGNAASALDFFDDSFPHLGTDGAGNWVAVWQSNFPFDDGSIGSDDDILVARSTDNGASWSAPTTLNTNAVSDSGDDNFPQLSTDGAGNWVAVWESRDDLGSTIGQDDDILVARSTDNGASWSAPTALNANASSDSSASDDQWPHLSTDGAGNWLTVWYYRPNFSTNPDIVVARSSDNGMSWSNPALVHPANAVLDEIPSVSTDGAGNWTVIWHRVDESEGTADILVARSRDNGITWGTPSALNTGALDTTDNYAPDIRADNASSWVAVWVSDPGSSALESIQYSRALTCDPTPASCRSALKSILVVKDKVDDSRDKVVWKWLRGDETMPSDFADPTNTTRYSLCLYAGATSSLLAETAVWPDAVKWAPLGDKGYKYKDKSGAASGVQKIVLKGGVSGKSKAIAKGRGSALPEITPPLALPVTVQLTNRETGVCFEGTYDTLDIKKNEVGQFKAKAQ